jgi:hypothetical protein
MRTIGFPGHPASRKGANGFGQNVGTVFQKHPGRFKRTGIFGLGQNGSGSAGSFIRGRVQKEKDGVSYCVADPELAAVLLTFMIGVGVRDPSGSERDLFDQQLGFELPSSIKVILTGRGSESAAKYIDAQRLAGKGIIGLELGDQGILISTNSLDLLRKLDTCAETGSPPVVLFEPRDGFVSEPNYLLYGGIAAGVILAGYLLMR